LGHPEELFWLAGYLEADGSFLITKQKRHGKEYRYIWIRVGTTDKDTAIKAADIMKVSKVLGPYGPYKNKGYPGKLPRYDVNVQGAKAAEIMMSIYKYMGMRRRQQIDICLLQWKNGSEN